MTNPDIGGRGRSQRDVIGHDDSYGQIYIAVIQLQGKVEALTQTITIRDASFTDEFRRMREDWASVRADHEGRIRMLESRRYVEPKTVWTAFSLSITLGVLVVSIINLITR